MRFNRDFELTIVVDDQSIIVKPPLRIAFNVTKSIDGSLNKMTIQVYNLKSQNRFSLAKNPDEKTRIPINLRVGYSGALENIFKGTVQKGETTGPSPDFITTLECLDGGFDFLNSFTSRTVKGKDVAINNILEDMPNTGKGKITEQNKLVRPKVLVGNSAKLIDQQLNEGETWYIDDERLYIIKEDEVVSSFAPVVSAKTGLINTPQLQESKVTFDTLMNPTVKVGGLVKLESANAPNLDGLYKVETIGYKGDNYGSTWSQSITCSKSESYTVI